MKRISIIALALALILVLASCTKKKEGDQATQEGTAPPTNAETKEPGSEEQLTGFDLQEGYETPIIFRN